MILANVMDLDLSRAFNTVDHTILLSKLDSYGIKRAAFKWLESYLSNRPLFTRVGQNNSDQEVITHGLPQGSVLGLPLFLVYTNDIINSMSSPYCELIMCADDCT